MKKVSIFSLLFFTLSIYSYATHKVDEDSPNQQITSSLILNTSTKAPAYFLGIIPKVVANEHILPRLKYGDFLAITLVSKACRDGMHFWWTKMNAIKKVCLAPNTSVVESEERGAAFALVKLYLLPLVSIQFCNGNLEASLNQTSLADLRGICYFAAGSLKRAISCTVLNLGYQQLTFVPDCIGQMSGLKELYLMNNRITKLPESIGRLPKLSILWIHNNLLSEIPESILNSRKLESFWFQNNPLKVTPKLIYSDLSGNKLSKSERIEKEGFTVKAKNEKAAVRAPKRQVAPKAVAKAPKQQVAPKAVAKAPKQQVAPKAAVKEPKQQVAPKAAAKAPKQQAAPKAAAKAPKQQAAPKVAAKAPNKGGR